MFMFIYFKNALLELDSGQTRNITIIRNSFESDLYNGLMDFCCEQDIPMKEV